MRRFTAIATTALALCPVRPALASDTPGAAPLSDQGILELAPGASIDAVTARHGLTTIDSIPSRNVYLVSFHPALTEDQFESLFLHDEDIDHSELNHASGDPGPDTQSTFVNRSAFDFLTDPTWDSLGLNAAHHAAQGEGVLVAVLDTGIDQTHPLLAGAVAPGAISFVPGFSALADNGNGIDDDGDGVTDKMVGHGTHAAGIIVRVAPRCSILSVRVMDDEGYGTAFAVAKGVYHATDQGARVINLSLSTLADLRVIERAVDEATSRGAVVVAAAGNQSSSTPEYPASTNKVISVASTDDAGVLAPFSNYGDDILVCAPGVEIPGPIPGGYGASDGTSASAPIVAGTAALLIEKHTAIRYDAFLSMLRETAIDVEPLNPAFEDALGFGLIDIEAALAWAGPCHADLNDDDLLTVDDVALFVTGFLAGGPVADFVPPFGSPNVDDLSFFLDSYRLGCPTD